MKPLVCVFAHPDDEAFGPAGSIAKFAQERSVYILCVTNGDAAESAHNQNKLGDIRKKELMQSAQILGVKHVEFLNFKDGGLCNNLYHTLAGKIEEKLLNLKPDALMTFEHKGISGHIDHITVSLVTTFVFKKLPFIKTLLYYCQLKEIMQEYKDYFIYMPPGYNYSEIDKTIDISPLWETKLRAMKTHSSQKKDAQRIIKVISKYPKQEHFLVLRK